MKKMLRVCLGMALVIGLVGCGTRHKRVLRVFNWGAYADMRVIREFEDKYDVHIVYTEFDSMESLYTKLTISPEYDIVIPSDNMSERLIKEGLVQEIDWSKIPNIVNIDPKLRNLDFDPEGKYTALYLYGAIGITYDKTIVDEEDLKDGWNLLMNTKYKKDVFMYDTIRESFMVGLKALGYSINTTSEKEIKEAYEWLVKQEDTMDSVYAGDDAIDLMRNSEKAIAVMFSGDAAAIMLDNEDLGFFMPEEGTDLFYDSLMITKDCADVDLAHEFINYMLDDEIAEKTTLEVGYTSPNINVFNKLKDDYLMGFGGINAYQPRIGYEKDEMWHYQSKEVKKIFEKYWTMLKAN